MRGFSACHSYKQKQSRLKMSSDQSDFEGFTASDIEDVNLDDEGSDIDVSPVSTPASSDSESDIDDNFVDETWTENVSRVHVNNFTREIGASFRLEPEKKEKDFFYKFFPESVFEHLVEETNGYAERCIQDKPDPKWRVTNLLEMMAFIGIHLIMSVVPFPSYTQAWTKQWPFSFPSIPEIMTRERFEKLAKYFHCNDTRQNPPRQQPGHDRLCHVRPILDGLNLRCLENYHPHREQSIDEGMIAYKGRLSFKQYLPAKPTKFGIKVWERADPHNGYVHQFQIYTGRETVQGTRVAEEGLGSRVVRDMTEKIWNRNHHIYMDNYFSSPALFCDLLNKGTYCCGTVRMNRKGMPQAIKSCKLKNRGEKKVMQKGQLVATVWKD